MRARTVSALAALAVLLAVPASSASAALLDQPPRLYTFKLDDPSSVHASRLALLDAFRDAAVEPSSGLRRYLAGTFGRWRAQPWWSLAWQSDPLDAEPALAPAAGEAPRVFFDEGVEPLFGFSSSSPPALHFTPETAPAWFTALEPPSPLLATTGQSFNSNGFDALWSLPPRKPIPNWRCRRRPVRIARYGGESDLFAIVRCDGSVAPEAFDRLTLMARETSSPRPGDLLPDEPDAAAVARGEWAPGVRLVHPRLLWAIQRVADAFPWRTLYVYSGYRHDPEGRVAKPGTHHSMHSEARALDITVMGVPNAALFQLCHGLADVGCGFYPNNRFVHVDIRRPASGHPFWIDTSAPGEPSRYVDAWPGVVDSGGLVWDAAARRGDQAQPATEASCTRRGAL